MTKEEIFEEAKIRYPVGTKFKVAHDPSRICTVSSHERYKTTFYEGHVNLLVSDGDKCEGGTVNYNGKWAEIVSKPEPKPSKVLIFNDIYVGDVVVTHQVSDRFVNERKAGDIYKVLDKSKKNTLYYKDATSSSASQDWRKATPEEEEAYNKGIRNIKDIVAPVITTKFEVGKWYKWRQENHNCSHYGKVETINSTHFQCSPWICRMETHHPSGSFDLNQSSQIEEINVSLVQKYLPEGHVDKIKSISKEPGKYYKISYSNGTGEYLIKTLGEKSINCVSIKNSTFVPITTYSEGYEIKDITIGEEEWLKSCILAGKFIPKEEALRTELTEFPSDGQCKTQDARLIEYLTKKFGTPTGGFKPAYIISWNNSSWWYVIASSGKKEYKLEELEKFLPKLEAMKKEKYVPKVGDFVKWNGTHGEYHEIWKIIGDRMWIDYHGDRGDYHNYSLKVEDLEKKEEKQSFFNEPPKTENWCVKITPENREIVKKWGDAIDDLKGKSFSKGAFYGWLNGRYNAHTEKSWCTPITTEEFYKKIGHVETPATPEYVECITKTGSQEHARGGKVYKILSWVNKEVFRFINEKGESDSASLGIHWKPSTKEAYEAQNKPKVMKKDVKELKYPDVVHIESQKEWDQLHAHRPEIQAYDSRYKYYLIGAGGGYAKDRAPYEDTSIYKYVIYEFSDITFPSKEPELIEGQWYECLLDRKKWIYQYKYLSGHHLLNGSKTSHSRCCKIGDSPQKGDNHITNDKYITNVKPANMEEVYKHFPEERPKVEEKGLKYAPDYVELTSLPDKWCIKNTKENAKELGKWRTMGEASLNRFLCYEGYKGVKGYSEATAIFPEITFEQFKKWVLKEEPKEQVMENLVGRWVKRISNKHYGDYHAVKVGEYDKIEKITSSDYWMDKFRSCAKDNFPKEWEVMPIGWTPETQKAMKYKIGDLVTITNVDNYKTSGIPHEKLIHGTYPLHYTAPNAKIVDIYNEYYIVNYINKENRIMQLGFLEKDITLRQQEKAKDYVHVTTQEQWDFVTQKLGYKWTDGNWPKYNTKTLINLITKSYNDTTSSNSYYSFEEWCTKFGHVFTPEKEQFKKGDWVVVIGESTSSNFTVGKAYQLGGKYWNENPGKFMIVKDDSGDENGSTSVKFRKALPHEIPTTTPVPKFSIGQKLKVCEKHQDVNKWGYAGGLEYQTSINGTAGDRGEVTKINVIKGRNYYELDCHSAYKGICEDCLTLVGEPVTSVTPSKPELWPVGTKVIINPSSEYAYQSKGTEGKITSHRSEDHVYNVEWEKGGGNCYRRTDLLLANIKETDPDTKATIMVDAEVTHIRLPKSASVTLKNTEREVNILVKTKQTIKLN